MIREVILPGLGSAGGFSGKKMKPNLLFVYQLYIPGSTIYITTG